MKKVNIIFIVLLIISIVMIDASFFLAMGVIPLQDADMAPPSAFIETQVCSVLFMVFLVAGTVLFWGTLIWRINYGIKKRKRTVTFTKVHYNKNRTVENNFDGLIDNPTWEQVEEYISKIIINEEEFVTLTLSDATYGIRYIQACKVKGKYSLQLGLEKDNSTNLVEAFFDQEELRRIFLEFYTYGVVANKEAYKPLLFET